MQQQTKQQHQHHHKTDISKNKTATPPSGKKEALSNVGGLLCCNDDALYEQVGGLEGGGGLALLFQFASLTFSLTFRGTFVVARFMFMLSLGCVGHPALKTDAPLQPPNSPKLRDLPK